MPRTRLTQQARKAKTREAIVAAATRRFALRGVEATSLDDVAEAAGFTKGAIYANFPNKRALVDAVIERNIVQIDPAILVRPDLSLADRLALIGREVAELTRTVPRETVLLDLEYSLAALRNPRKRATLPDRLRAQQTQSKDVPAQFDALNAAQGAHPPIESAELLRLAAILARGIIRAAAEMPDALTPGAIETLFRLLAGGEPTAAPVHESRRQRRDQ
jgi:AcrR family transcriptional regulator